MPEKMQPPQPETGLDVKIDKMSFDRRKDFYRELKEAQKRLEKEVRLTDDGLEMIDGTKIHTEGEDDDWIIRGIEYLYPKRGKIVDWGRKMPAYETKEDAMKKIIEIAELYGYKITK